MWVRIEDVMPEHPKFQEVGDTAFALFVSGLCYSVRLLTDGRIPERQVPKLIHASPRKATTELVAAGLWHEVDGGYQVHDFDHYQPSAQKVQDQRRKERDKKAKQRGTTDNVPDLSPGDNERDVEGTLTRASAQASVSGSVVGEAVDVEPKTTAVARDLFAYWQQTCGHPHAKASAKRLRLIRDRLKDFDPDEIRTAINGAARNAYVDANGVKHDAIELICRDVEHVELNIKRAVATPQRTSGDYDKEQLARERLSGMPLTIEGRAA